MGVTVLQETGFYSNGNGKPLQEVELVNFATELQF